MIWKKENSPLEPVKFRIITNGIEFALEYFDWMEWRRCLTMGRKHAHLRTFKSIKQINVFLKSNYGEHYTLELRTWRVL